MLPGSSAQRRRPRSNATSTGVETPVRKLDATIDSELEGHDVKLQYAIEKCTQLIASKDFTDIDMKSWERSSTFGDRTELATQMAFDYQQCVKENAEIWFEEHPIVERLQALKRTASDAGQGDTQNRIQSSSTLVPRANSSSKKEEVKSVEVQRQRLLEAKRKKVELFKRQLAEMKKENDEMQQANEDKRASLAAQDKFAACQNERETLEAFFQRETNERVTEQEVLAIRYKRVPLLDIKSRKAGA